jgi:hypothetical protein
MVLRQLLAAAAVVGLLTPRGSRGDDARYVQQGGTLYRETRSVVNRPVVETRMQETTQTAYREEVTTQMRPTCRTYWTPVTQYHCEAYLANRWNPLAIPYLAYRMVPQTHWECRAETVQTPVTCRRLVPFSQKVCHPVTVCRMVPEEVTTRVAVRGPTPTVASVAPQPAAPTRYEQIGGIAILDKDPPREGVSTAWRPSETLR